MEELKQRWIGILRAKASQYEHLARKNGEDITQPDLDDICNEMEIFFTGMDKCFNHKEIINPVGNIQSGPGGGNGNTFGRYDSN